MRRPCPGQEESHCQAEGSGFHTLGLHGPGREFLATRGYLSGIKLKIHFLSSASKTSLSRHRCLVAAVLGSIQGPSRSQEVPPDSPALDSGNPGRFTTWAVRGSGLCHARTWLWREEKAHTSSGILSLCVQRKPPESGEEKGMRNDVRLLLEQVSPDGYGGETGGADRGYSDPGLLPSGADGLSCSSPSHGPCLPHVHSPWLHGTCRDAAPGCQGSRRPAALATRTPRLLQAAFGEMGVVLLGTQERTATLGVQWCCSSSDMGPKCESVSPSRQGATVRRGWERPEARKVLFHTYF